jgi:hypothetical protein
MARVDLTVHEMLVCQTLGVLRRSSAMGNVKDQQMGDQSPWNIDVDGVIGEMCVAKHFNVFPDMSVGIRKGGADLFIKNKSIDVKTTRIKSGKLLSTLKKIEDPCDVYMLVIVDDKGGDIVGWIEKEKLFLPENIADLGHGKGYVLKQEQLNKILRRSNVKDNTNT